MKYCVNMATPTTNRRQRSQSPSHQLRQLGDARRDGCDGVFVRIPAARRGGVTARTRARKQRPAAGTVETMVVDVIEEPVPGVVTITEFEEVRIPMLDSDEETKD